MDQNASTYDEKIRRCEAAIIRIREARASHDNDSDAVNRDYQLITDLVKPYFMNNARRLQPLSPLLKEEALEIMYDRLLKAIMSPKFPSLETQFGAYLRDMPAAVEGSLRQKFFRSTGEANITRLDRNIKDIDGETLHDVIDDQSVLRTFREIEDTELIEHLIAKLPIDEQKIIYWKILKDETSRKIAKRLGISESTITRIYQRAITSIKKILNSEEN